MARLSRITITYQDASADVPSTKETDLNMEDVPVTKNGATDTRDNDVKM